jgi:hypothetical protein
MKDSTLTVTAALISNPPETGSLSDFKAPNINNGKENITPAIDTTVASVTQGLHFFSTLASCKAGTGPSGATLVVASIITKSTYSEHLGTRVRT